MLNRYIPFLLVLVTALTSCSTDDTPIINESNQPLLKSYKISRDANGVYTVDYKLADGANGEFIKDVETNTNNFYAYEDAAASATTKNANLNLSNKELKLGVFENDAQRRSITVEDENIVLAKGVVSTNYLETYSIEHLGSDEYVLDFTIRDGVNASFEYNADENIFEVHLKEGKSNGTNFTKLYKKSPSLPLRIDFVNYIANKVLASSDKNSSSKSTLYTVSYTKKNKPRVSVDL
ncbi:hypothetical protein [Tenacibaculum agarivorans]|uniref:hypothetical protein n=1 Tax=Tenacibaculum agarivorans TaxID=1908389 RepID=UPI00094B9A5C|nr:hypothetical protein [Tenacibaculum agarivorans]